MIFHIRNRQLLPALVALVGVAILFVLVPYLAYRTIELATNGVQTTATVTGKTTEDPSNPNATSTTGDTAYHIQYTFSPPGGQPVAGDDTVDGAQWTSLAAGSRITITYVPSDPGNNVVGTGRYGLIGYLAFLIPIGAGLVLTLVGGRLFLIARAQANLGARMLRLGVRATGTVVNPKAAMAFFNGQPYERLSYRYSDPSGKEWTGLSDWQPIAVAHLWKAGASGHIRYDPAKPADSYWFGATDPAGS